MSGKGPDMACACGQCSVAERRALGEVRLLVIRFILSFVIFAVAIVLSFRGLGGRPLLALYLASWLVAGYRVLASALRGIARGKVFDENFLMSIATVGAFLIGQWSEGAAVMLFYNLGEMIQESAVNKSRRSITDLMDVRPSSALLADGREVHPAEVALGDAIRVVPGAKVPLDGVVESGFSSVDASRLTGESVPRDVGPGSEVLAGFVNGGGELVVRVGARFQDTAAARMLSLVEGAQARKARAERLITSFSRVYTPIVTVGAVLLALIPPLVLRAAFEPWVSRALVFLVISCPCAFVISVPLGFFGGIGGAARLGVLVKGADFLDALAKTRAVVFDKTGTLTRGALSVSRLEPAPGVRERELLGLAAEAESRSTHPAAAAIRAHAAASSPAADVAEYRERAGFGTIARVGGHILVAGSRRHLVAEGVSDLPPPFAGSGTCVEIARDGEYAGRVVLADEPKADAARAVAELKALGVSRVAMLSGDSRLAARSVADAVGIDEAHAEILPHEKVERFADIAAEVREAHPKGVVVFVGDGINDAPALARADVGIAMGGIGSDAAVEAADVVLMNDSPLSVPLAIRSARWTRRIVAQNIALSFVVKIGFLALGAVGVATLWEAVFADVGVALLATVNSLRARRLPGRAIPIPIE
jgi:Cd2+/Zn2+-exporting ATPase